MTNDVTQNAPVVACWRKGSRVTASKQLLLVIFRIDGRCAVVPEYIAAV